jgi:hypothetical protein
MIDNSFFKVTLHFIHKHLLKTHETVPLIKYFQVISMAGSSFGKSTFITGMKTSLFRTWLKV